MSTFSASFVALLGLVACSIPDAKEEAKDEKVVAVNPLTGEVKEFSDPDQIPPGWQTCPDPQSCPAPIACENLDEASCLSRPDCEPLYAAYEPTNECNEPGCGIVFMECLASSGSGGSGPCPLSQCNVQCPPGTTYPVDPTGCANTCECVPEASGCDPIECGPPPGASPPCPSGAASETVCEAQPDGSCGWSFNCP